MKNLCALLATFALALSTPLAAQIVRVQTVVSRYVEADKTELVGSRPLMAMSTPATATFNNVTVSLLTSEVDAKTVRIIPRLTEKLPDGLTRRHEAGSITVPIGETAILRLGGYLLELTPAISEPTFLTIDYPGGPLTDLLKTLPKENRIPFNLVGEKADMATELPPLSLKLTSPDALAHALNQILNTRGLVITPSSGASDAYSSRSIFVLKRIVDPDAGKPASEPRFRSYHLGDHLTGKQTIDEITGAIRAAWEITPGAKPDQLVLKYHPGTSLLLVTGPESAIKTTETVLASLSPANRIAADAARLEQVAAEVRRRREARMSGLPVESSAQPSALTTPAPDPNASPAENAARLNTVSEEIRQRRAAREATAADLEKRMEELRAETERLRSSRPPVEKTTPPPTPPPAPAATK